MMSIKNRLKKIESKVTKLNCFCGKTLINLWHGKLGALTFCPKCKGKFDHWTEIAAEAAEMNNLTNEIEG